MRTHRRYLITIQDERSRALLLRAFVMNLMVIDFFFMSLTTVDLIAMDLTVVEK